MSTKSTLAFLLWVKYGSSMRSHLACNGLSLGWPKAALLVRTGCGNDSFYTWCENKKKKKKSSAPSKGTGDSNSDTLYGEDKRLVHTGPKPLQKIHNSQQTSTVWVLLLLILMGVVDKDGGLRFFWLFLDTVEGGHDAQVVELTFLVLDCDFGGIPWWP
ncbi:hypothetical protein F0562_033470 [Nyssa sinensis]|uniref:Uncharacterized protein n=1 Tax=Nyssa sinensis TaxID=561372 RepID=A0A5J5AGR1_9ASTE|nr:hypothetical protein F0562_033470 [Nyssa sinensis]